jgi:hypothetical protein
MGGVYRILIAPPPLGRTTAVGCDQTIAARATLVPDEVIPGSGSPGHCPSWPPGRCSRSFCATLPCSATTYEPPPLRCRDHVGRGRPRPAHRQARGCACSSGRSRWTPRRGSPRPAGPAPAGHRAHSGRGQQVGQVVHGPVQPPSPPSSVWILFTGRGQLCGLGLRAAQCPAGLGETTAKTTLKLTGSKTVGEGIPITGPAREGPHVEPSRTRSHVRFTATASWASRRRALMARSPTTVQTSIRSTDSSSVAGDRANSTSTSATEYAASA